MPVFIVPLGSARFGPSPLSPAGLHRVLSRAAHSWDGLTAAPPRDPPRLHQPAATLWPSSALLLPWHLPGHRPAIRRGSLLVTYLGHTKDSPHLLVFERRARTDEVCRKRSSASLQRREPAHDSAHPTAPVPSFQRLCSVSLLLTHLTSDNLAPSPRTSGYLPGCVRPVSFVVLVHRSVRSLRHVPSSLTASTPRDPRLPRSS